MNFEDEMEDRPTAVPPEREISLGMGTILGMFLALVLICAAFFGFGYSMGHRAALTAAASIPETNTAVNTDKTDSTFSNFKTAPPASATKSTGPPASSAADTATQSEDRSATSSTDGAKADPVSTTGTDAVSQPQVTADGPWMVQVSATTRKADAEALTKVLVGKGFTAMIKPDQDQKFHVRVGPFASKKDADTTRKLLVAGGYKDPFLTPR